ncbi:TadE/TadG family type IV pilus assembly protein [Sphingomonas sp. MA1305]|uniref:TadE/TadG family type IV pilus assembly protein n=1 Tax=Sphingomonas sp. MA1305 TaxID=2479204 RepID=UPI001E5EFEBB|nr:hypothetical protein [Sphingomonas sp. MA1305]
MPALMVMASQLSGKLRALRGDMRGVALIEFAYSLPIVLAIGAWGVELSNLALCHLRVSQYALNLADHATRVGQTSSGVTNFRENDANDVLRGAKLEGAGIALTTRGRITITSLENVQQSYDTQPVQRIHWQRCLGVPSGAGYDSSYGTVTSSAGSDGTQANAGITAPNGIGDPNRMVSAPASSGVMFVEINYLYKPLFGSFFVAPRIIHYTASFLVRDNRSFVQIYNPSPSATPSTCDKHIA